MHVQNWGRSSPPIVKIWNNIMRHRAKHDKKYVKMHLIHHILSYTLINVKPFWCLCLRRSQTVCRVHVARPRVSHARNIINVNPFLCLCVPASHFWWHVVFFRAPPVRREGGGRRGGGRGEERKKEIERNREK